MRTDLIDDVAALAGVGVLAAGFYLVHPAGGYIVIGFVLIAYGIRGAMK